MCKAQIFWIFFRHAWAPSPMNKTPEGNKSDGSEGGSKYSNKGGSAWGGDWDIWMQFVREAIQFSSWSSETFVVARQRLGRSTSWLFVMWETVQNCSWSATTRPCSYLREALRLFHLLQWILAIVSLEGARAWPRDGQRIRLWCMWQGICAAIQSEASHGHA